MDIQQEARAGRCVPSNRLRPAHCHRHERLDGGAVSARGHAARIVRPLAPQWRHGGRFANLRTFATTFGRKPVAHAVGCIHGRRIEQEDRRDGQCLEEGSHEGEVQVYRSGESLQQIPTGGRRSGGETGGAGCRIVGEERVHGGVRLHPSLAYGVNAGLPTSIPTQMPVSQPRPETPGLCRLEGVRVPRGLESGSSRVRHRRDSVDTTAESRGFFALGRCR